MPAHFTSDLFQFLSDLEANNNRDWFNANKQRYESSCRDPMLRFIADFEPKLREISPHFVADPRPSGGSMFRIYRDTRFSNDKSPYKTNIAAHFPHVDSGKVTSTPGYYITLSPGECYAGAGLWRPDPLALAKVREAIVTDPESWSGIAGKLSHGEDTLARPPRGFDPNHPFIEDIKRKSFVMGVAFADEQVSAQDFLDTFAATCRNFTPLMQFLSLAVGIAW